MTKLDDAKKLVSELSADDRAKLGAYLKVINQFGKAAPAEEAKQDDVAAMILEMICRVLADRGLDFTKPYSLAATQGYRAFRRKIAADEIGKWIAEVAGKNKGRQRAFTRLAVTLLCDNMAVIGTSTNSRTMMAQVHRLQTVVNDSFPGYAEAGLMDLIIKQQQQGD